MRRGKSTKSAQNKILPFLARKKTLIEARIGTLRAEGNLYDLWILKRAYFVYEDKD